MPPLNQPDSAWVYTPGGLPSLWSEGAPEAWESAFSYEYDEAGGLLALVEARLTTLESWRTTYASDSLHNIVRVEGDDGEAWAEYSFDCHPPQ